VITVQRHNPKTHKAVYAICHTAFYGRGESPNFPIKIPNKISRILCYAKIEMKKKKVIFVCDHFKLNKENYFY
jgi:hypothetical protein